MARDIFSIPASGAGVERLFNCARDICHYRRGQLKPGTIKDLMLHLFSSKFDLEQSELEMIKEYLSNGEATLLDQIRKPAPSLNELKGISDNEEEGYEVEDTSEDDIDDDDAEESEESEDSDESEDELSESHTQATTRNKQARRKQPQKRTFEALDDADNGLPLPEMPTEGSTQARPGRIRKMPKMPAGFEVDRL
jgi:hypothetical protein